MNDEITVSTVVKKLGRQDMAVRLGIVATSIDNAVKRGEFPAAWHSVVMDMAKERGVTVPYGLFRMLGAGS